MRKSESCYKISINCIGSASVHLEPKLVANSYAIRYGSATLAPVFNQYYTPPFK